MRLIFLFIAIALAGAAFFVTMNLTKEEAKPAQPIIQETKVVVKEVPTVDVFVARQDIPIGTEITRAMLDVQPWPKHLLLPDFVTIEGDPSSAGTIDKMVARTPFQKGEVVMRSKLANPKDPSFLAAALAENMRAVTIQADPISGVGGFVFPGDRVDLLITHNVNTGSQTLDEKGKTAAPAEPVTEVLLSNVKVLAVNQRATMQGAEGPQMPSSFTLEVGQIDAQKIRLTELAGARLSLTLRSVKDKDDFSLVRPTGRGDLSRITPPSYFAVLYDKKSSYTPTIVSGDGKVLTKGEGSVSTSGVIPQQTPLANLVKDGINQEAGGNVITSADDKTIIAVVRGVRMEPVEVQGP